MIHDTTVCVSGEKMNSVERSTFVVYVGAHSLLGGGGGGGGGGEDGKNRTR